MKSFCPRTGNCWRPLPDDRLALSTFVHWRPRSRGLSFQMRLGALDAAALSVACSTLINAPCSALSAIIPVRQSVPERIYWYALVEAVRVVLGQLHEDAQNPNTWVCRSPNPET